MATNLMEAPPTDGIEQRIELLTQPGEGDSHSIVLLEPRVINGYTQYSVLLPEELNQGKTAEGVLC